MATQSLHPCILVTLGRVAPGAVGEEQEKGAGSEQDQLFRYVTKEGFPHEYGKPVKYQKGKEYARDDGADSISVRQRHGDELALVAHLGEEKEGEGG